eukprot:TRINITY_DN120_c1_g2_i1.p2 TRINITY_DN120_c1_g2~~TRINITY_DN120_c1_g2_i1.p2  ORF type:complete len:406 (+),score=159.27 TRINITY_DN120_c1_g2_i1:81-1298(+)
MLGAVRRAARRGGPAAAAAGRRQQGPNAGQRGTVRRGPTYSTGAGSTAADAIGRAAAEASSVLSKVPAEGGGEESADHGEDYHVAMLRLLRRAVRGRLQVVMQEEGSTQVAGFTEELPQGTASFALAFSSPEEHDVLLEHCTNAEDEAMRSAVAPVKDMSGAELVMRLVAIAVAQEDMQAQQRQAHEAAQTAGEPAPEGGNEAWNTVVGGFRLNGFPVPLSSAHVDAVLTSFRVEKLLGAARGDAPPSDVGPEMQMLGAAFGKEAALKTLEGITFFIPMTEAPPDEAGGSPTLRPILSPMTERPEDGAGLPVFADKLSAWLFVHRGIALDDPEVRVKLQKCTGAKLWDVCRVLCSGDDAAAGLVLNPLPHTEPREGEVTPLVLLSKQMWWLNDPPPKEAAAEGAA